MSRVLTGKDARLFIDGEEIAMVTDPIVFDHAAPEGDSSITMTFVGTGLDIKTESEDEKLERFKADPTEYLNGTTRTQHYREGYYVDLWNKMFPIRDMNDKKIRDAIKDLQSRIVPESQEVIREISIDQLRLEQNTRKESQRFMDRLKAL